MTTTHITAAQISDARSHAVIAVRDLYSEHRDGVIDQAEAEREAINRVTDAVRTYGVTAAQIASLAGVRQVMVARLINDDHCRAEALVAARDDAERYLTNVRHAIRSDVELSVSRGMSEAQASRLYGVTRETVRKWLGK